MGAVVSVARGVATEIVTVVTIVAGVTIVGSGSDGVVPVPVTDGVATGMVSRDGETDTDSTVATTISAVVMVTVAGRTAIAGTSGDAGIATSAGTSAATTDRGVSAVPGGIVRNIRAAVENTSVAAVMTAADPGMRAVTFGDPVTSIPSSRTR